MTREEAARLLDPETTWYELWKHEEEMSLAACNEACRMGADALRAQQEREHPKQITNADRIRAMSDEDLAWELMLWRCESAAKYYGIESQYPDTHSKILDWLQQPAEEG